MIYKRKIFAQVEKELETKEATVITGLRQSGKTTVLKHLFSKVASQNKVVFDLEDPLNRKIFETNSYTSIWQKLAPFGIQNDEKSYIFLDEIQNMPEIPKIVKFLSDHYPVKF